jgi:hypothetical protein
MSVKNSLFVAQTFPVPVGTPKPCLINISGYALENYKKLNPEGYTILCETGKYCDVLSFFPNSKTIVLEGNSQSQMLFTDFPQKFIPELAEKLDTTPRSAFEKSVEFFQDKRVVVQPTGLQGKVYKSMRSLQNYGPVAYTFEAISVAKTTGLTGLKVITGAPMTFVGVTYLGGMVCAYFGAVAGDNAVGSILNYSSYVLTRPMRGVELTLNGLILEPLSVLTGFPLILNGTNEILAGKGINITDFAKIGASFERVSKVTQKLKKAYNATKKIFTGD